ncbi:MAG TPA: family 20 glycosylhydrolase, partial [Longimicrobiaceae bacterium]|nr:family 20 glycosylhydrolase [Longimicrobiaceae bacterium]
TLHLHLADDQGWRIMIDSWPRLATYGGEIEVNGTPGGYYTKAEYSDIVRYAQPHFITVVPEIDMPGHTNAALASYPELNCNGVAPERYTGMHVGFSSLCVDQESTYLFVDDVVRELAALTPGPYLHIGGDEVRTLTPEQYIRFVNRVQAIVAAHGKRAIGWEEIGKADLLPGTAVQSWKTDSATVAVEKGAKIVFSPATHVYLDMKYDPITPLGNSWAGYVSVEKSYDWDPATFLPGVPDSLVLGVESPIWSETLWNIHDVEFMAFPRLPGVAEIGWSPEAKRDWEDFRTRLAAQAPRWAVMRLPYFRAPDVPWKR